MTDQTPIVILADRLLDDLRMIPRGRRLLDRIAANARAYGIARKNLPERLHCAWERLIPAAVAFCERFAARSAGEDIKKEFEDPDRLDLRDDVFDDDDIDTLKLFARAPQCATVAAEALDIIRQCRHIQVLLHAKHRRAAA